MSGVTTWVKPKYTRVVTHKLPSGCKLTVKAGTQIIDRFWSHLRQPPSGGRIGTKRMLFRSLC